MPIESLSGFTALCESRHGARRAAQAKSRPARRECHAKGRGGTGGNKFSPDFGFEEDIRNKVPLFHRTCSLLRRLTFLENTHTLTNFTPRVTRGDTKNHPTSITDNTIHLKAVEKLYSKWAYPEKSSRWRTVAQLDTGSHNDHSGVILAR